MRSKGFVAVVAFLVIALGGAGAVYAYDQSKTNTIGKGVSIGGVDVSGLSPAAARAKLRRRFERKLRGRVVVRWRGRTFALTSEQARVHANFSGSVDEALARSRDGNIFTRTARNLTGSRLNVDLKPEIAYSHRAVTRLGERVARAVDRPVREASVAFSSTGPDIQHGQDGYVLRRTALLASVGRGLAGRGDRTVRARVTTIHPKKGDDTIPKRYDTIVFVDRANFRLSLYKHLKLVKSYTIAVGMQGLETPTGEYPVTDKQVDPSWHVPNSAWAGSLAGQVIPPGPADPIKARWIGVTGGAGIHGTTETYSLGTAGSHGCIRMAIPDVIQLYDQVPYGSTIYIS